MFSKKEQKTKEKSPSKSPKITISISKSKLKGLNLNEDDDSVAIVQEEKTPQVTQPINSSSGPATSKKSKNLTNKAVTTAPETRKSPRKEAVNPLLTKV